MTTKSGPPWLPDVPAGAGGINAEAAVKCRHCKAKATRAKGLCWRCSTTPEICRMYKSLSKFAQHDDDFNGGYRSGEPTAALPGTEEKMDVLRGRVEQRLALWAPGDGRRKAD